MSNLSPSLSLLVLKMMMGMPDSHVQKIHEELLHEFNKICTDLRKVNNRSSERKTNALL